MKVQYFTVTSAEKDMKVWQFLARVCSGVSKTLFRKWIRKGEVRVNSCRVSFDHRLACGDSVRIPPFRQDNCEKPVPEKKIIPLTIIFRNDQLLAFCKSPGVPVHSGTSHEYGITDCLNSEGVFQPVPVHRLDIETSGVLIFALSYQMLSFLKQNWDQTEKYYIALVSEKNQKLPSGKTAVLKSECDGKYAFLKFRRLCSCGRNALVLIRLFTGRNHQIRVQMSEAGFPLCGDRKHGIPGGKMFLHCHKMIIPSPDGKKTMIRARVVLPQDT